MFSKSQGISKPDKAPAKQSVFPSGGNILKKKARSTILSVLSKRQTQEKLLLGDKTEGREQQNSTVSSVEPSLHQTKWQSPNAMVVDLASDSGSTKNWQRSGSVEAKSLSYQYETPNQNWASSNTNNNASKANFNEQNDEKLTHLVDGRQVPEHSVLGQDFVENTNGSKLSSRLPYESLYVDRGQTDQNIQSLGNRRNFAPRHLPRSEVSSDVSQAMVVSMSPSYTSVKDISPSSPLSPKSVSDSVKVSIPFQVQGQQQCFRPEQSDVWSSTVNVCVPFQVNEHGASVPVSGSFGNALLDTQTTQQVARKSSVPFLQEPLQSPSSNTASVSESPTDKRNTENAYSSTMDKMSTSEPSFPKKSSSFLHPDDVTVSQDMTDGVGSTKPRSHSSPTPGKRKPHKENHTRDNQVSKEQSIKTMGKEASKHKSTTADKPVNYTAQKGPTAGKPRARSFNVADRNKLTPGPSHTPPSPAGTPKSRSPASSPKLMRRNITPKDVSKGRSNSSRKTADPKKQDSRPYSDPLIGEKIHGKKKISGVATNDASTTGKAKPELEMLKSKVKELEGEKLEQQEKIQGMEHRLAVVPLLEKEKLHLQKQFNELVQENEKKLAELQSLNLESEKQREEKHELLIKQEELVKAMEKSKKELEELKEQNCSLEESKSTLARENEEKMQSIAKYLEDIEQLTSSNTMLVLQESRLRNTISTLLQGLKALKDSVLQLKEENKCLQSQIIENGNEFVGRMRNCVNGLEKVVEGLEKEKSDTFEEGTQVSSETLDKDTQCDELPSVQLEELDENKNLIESLQIRINELENQKETSEVAVTPNVANEQNMAAVCLGCVSLEEQLTCLKSSVDSLKTALEKSESDLNDAVEERNELRREAKYLKYVLSYRSDVQSLQMSNQQSKELEKMESNLVEAEKKVGDLEDEVGRLYEEKQTLLLSILNLHSGHEVEDVKEEDEEDLEEDEENMAPSEESENNNEDQDKGSTSEGARTPDSISRREQLKFRFQLSLSESEYSYSSEQRTEGEEESESEDEQEDEDVTVQAGMNIKKIKTENKQLKSRLSEATDEKEELLTSLDKLCEEFDSLKEDFDKLEEENAVLSKRSKHDKDTLQARLKEVEMDRENMRDSLRQVQDEKLALLKCLETRDPAEPMTPLSPLTRMDLDKIISRAQSFTREENKSSEPTSNEEYSDGSSSSDSEDEQTSKPVLKSTPDNRVQLQRQPEVTSSPAEDRDLASLVANIENDLGKLKERLNKRGGDTPEDVQDENTGKGVDTRPRKPPPGERILKRQASTVKSNLDRVCRERQHLQDEVESLRRYLLKRRDSAMHVKKRSRGSLKRATDEVENHLEGIKTLQVLLGKSDEQLRQSNDIISRLEAVNDETEEKLRDAELLKDDMRHAVEIANNFAMEEQEKAEKFMLQNQELLKTIEMLKNNKEKPTGKGKSKFQLTEAKGFNRSVSEDDGLYPDDESTFTTEGESDFYSSRHSSIASESDFVRSPTSGDENVDSFDSHVRQQRSAKNGDIETEGTSQHSSTADTSDMTDDETE